MARKTKIRKLKKWGVFPSVNSTYSPFDWLGALSIFNSKKQAEYWVGTRVNTYNKVSIIPVTIVYEL